VRSRAVEPPLLLVVEQGADLGMVLEAQGVPPAGQLEAAGDDGVLRSVW
jgi:hypothetical protein